MQRGITLTGPGPFTVDQLNQLGDITVDLEGAIAAASIADGAITETKYAANSIPATAFKTETISQTFLTKDARREDVSGQFRTLRAGTKLLADIVSITRSGGTATVTTLAAHGLSPGDRVRIAGMAQTEYNIAVAVATAPTTTTFTYAVSGSPTTPATGLGTVFSTNKLVLTAAEAVLLNAARGAVIATAISYEATLSSTPALNSIDVGTEAASTWYYVWLVTDGTSTGLLLSTSATAPDAGVFAWTHKCLVGMVYNDANQDLNWFTQADRRIWLQDLNIFTAKSVTTVNVGQLLSGTDLTNFRAAIPPEAQTYMAQVGRTNSPGAISVGNVQFSQYANMLAGYYHHDYAPSTPTAVYNFTTVSSFELPPHRESVGGARNLVWRSNDATDTWRLNITGFTF